MKSNGSVDVCIENEQWLEESLRKDWKKISQKCLDMTFSITKWTTPSQVSFVLTDDFHIQQLNSHYRHQNCPTNVLSFPLLDFSQPTLPLSSIFEYHLLGDVVLSFETVLKESNILKRSFLDHTFHLMVHGILHLLGYNHEEEVEAALMEGLEVQILQQFEISDPYV